MAPRDHKRELVENLIRLRRAIHATPANRDLAAVRDSLERELGPGVSQRLAARVLGTSHTTVARLIADRDIATIPTPEGRSLVPVTEVLRLREGVDQHRDGLRGLVRERRAYAARLDPAALVAPGPPPHGHRGAELRGLAYHRAVAARLSGEMITDAQQRLYSWQRRGQIDPRYAERWEAALRRPLPQIRQLIVDEGDEATELRQNSPFAGLLSEPERRRVIAGVQ